jgi:hypothetical protein
MRSNAPRAAGPDLPARAGSAFFRRNSLFSEFFPCYLIFWTPPLSPFWRENGGIQAFSGKSPVKLTGNFFARNREFRFVEQGIFCTEQGIQFRGTGNSERRLRYERRDYAHRLHQQRENRPFAVRNCIGKPVGRAWMAGRRCCFAPSLDWAAQFVSAIALPWWGRNFAAPIDSFFGHGHFALVADRAGEFR